ncbi:hypothetical protein [Variovorax saccharolyticus]|uniref:hypothetical protein n=1 Tax=Variovorax saccharolyticus TaxID=3053516 RepID=UPI002576394C|nr:hypothetical protein [Variovorax sp. J31P216]MDM0024113.1 hypothetical protein [Variovorax sp. J31P216]
MNDTAFHAPVSLAEQRARRRPGHWADKPEVDARVSVAEQEDQMPDHDSVVIPVWLVCLGLTLAPLLVIGVSALVAALLRS